MLEVVGQHMIDVTRFLRMIGESEAPSIFPAREPKAEPSIQQRQRKKKQESLKSISEEEPAVSNLSNNVAEFSIDSL